MNRRKISSFYLNDGIIPAWWVWVATALFMLALAWIMSACHAPAPSLEPGAGPINPNAGCEAIVPRLEPYRPPVRLQAGPLRRDSGETIDWMILWTPQMASAHSTATMLASINQGIQWENESRVAQGVKPLIRLVYTGVCVGFVEFNASTDLYAFKNSPAAYALRNKYGADCCGLLESNLGGPAGMAFMLTDLNPNFEAWAFGVFQWGYISYFSMAHEIGGHLNGLNHDSNNASTVAVWPFNYGWRTANAQKRCKMSYAPGTRINLYSDPDTYVDGLPFGSIEKCNAVRVLNITSETCANFRLSIAPGTPTPVPSITPTPTISPVPTATVTPQPGTRFVNAPTSATLRQIVSVTWYAPEKCDFYLIQGAGDVLGGNKWYAGTASQSPAVLNVVGKIGTDRIMMKGQTTATKTYSGEFQVQ